MKKVYTTRVDTIMVTCVASDLEDLYSFLLDVDDRFFIKDNELYFDFDSIQMKCTTEEISLDETKLIQFESH